MLFLLVVCSTYSFTVLLEDITRAVLLVGLFLTCSVLQSYLLLVQSYFLQSYSLLVVLLLAVLLVGTLVTGILLRTVLLLTVV